MSNSEELNRLENITVVDLAMVLEDGLLNGQWLDREMSAKEFVQTFLKEYIQGKQAKRDVVFCDMVCFVVVNHRAPIFPEALMTIPMHFPIRYREDKFEEAARLVNEEGNPYMCIGYATKAEEAVVKASLKKIIERESDVSLYVGRGTVESELCDKTKQIDLHSDTGTAIYHSFVKMKKAKP